MNYWASEINQMDKGGQVQNSVPYVNKWGFEGCFSYEYFC